METRSEDLTVSQLTEMWPRLARSTLYRWIKTGRIKAIDLPGKLRVPASEIDRLAKEVEAAKEVLV